MLKVLLWAIGFEGSGRAFVLVVRERERFAKEKEKSFMFWEESVDRKVLFIFLIGNLI